MRTRLPAPRIASLPRLLVLVVGFFLVAAIVSRDAVAAGIVAAGVAVIAWVLRRRSPGRLRAGAVALLALTTCAAMVAAFVLPTYRGRPGPLVVTKEPPSKGVLPHVAPVSQATSGSNFISLGFVATDYDDSPTGVDRDVPLLSTVAATGIVLAKSPGSIEVASATDSLVRAHLNGATGLAVVSNFDGTDFNPGRAKAMLGSRAARRRFISAVSGEVARHGWDGVVLDFEQLPPSVREDYVKLVHGLTVALGTRELTVAIPALLSDDPDLAAYDLAGLGAAADHIVWMAYDQHELQDAPGPVAGLPWVEQTLQVAEKAIPRSKILLGVANYGYAWRAPADATEETVAGAQALAAEKGAVPSWDETQQEWTVQTRDGRTMWYEDARAFGVRAKLALDQGLGGVALWRVGSDEPATLQSLPVPPAKHPSLPSTRSVEQVSATGVAALTFDDGPDPTWTPRILRILAREHVPATFFVIGTAAQQHQALVRREVRHGDVVGNHTYSHKNLANLPAWRAKMEILGGQSVVEGITGLKPSLFRSPYGAGDMSGGKVGSDQLAADIGSHPVNWNDDPEDWQSPAPAEIVRRVVANAGERTVILLHDGGGDRAATVAALPGIIHELHARGYVFATVDALDASVGSPYAPRNGLLSSFRGVLIVAGFRIQMALRRMILWLLVTVALLSTVRLVAAAALGIAHRRRVRRPRLDGDIGSAPAPTVSVLIPAHNEAQVLRKTLETVARARGVHEVIVIDDGSTDDTAEVAGRYSCTVVTQPQAGKAAALNRGVRMASGEVVLVIDADTVIAPDFVSTVAEHFRDPAVGAVAGNVKVGNRRRLLPRLQALEYIVSINLDRRAQAMLNVIAVVPGAAGAFRRRAVIDAGGYVDDTLVEDADLTVALLRAGWRIDYEADAVAWTEAPESVRDIVRQRRRWSFGTVEVAAKHASALLNAGEGRVGLIGLPWLVLSQVLLPLGGPLTDLFLLYLLTTGALPLAALLIAIGAVTDLAVCGLAIALDGEDWRLLPYALLLRLVWRPLQLITVMASVRRWVRGERELWRRAARYDTVELDIVMPDDPQKLAV